MTDSLAQAPFMLWVVLAFLGLSLLLYCLLAGADFGAGALELFMRREDRLTQRKIVERALGPVWEANHMWLILMVVILFVGFPAVYTRVSINLHLPLTAMLLGIIARGCSFTFRHYDAVQGRSQRPYTYFFIFSSFWTPFCLGVVMGALIPGSIDPEALGYLEGYVRPWLRPFPMALGLFTVCLFSFLAAVYLIGESPVGPIRRHFERRAMTTSWLSIVGGALVFLAAEWDGIALGSLFLGSVTAILCMALATVLMPILWLGLSRHWGWTLRVIAGTQITLILGAWLKVQFPVLVHLQTGADLTVFNSHAPEAALWQLGMALLVGSAFILPALYYLLRVFKLEGPLQPSPD